jgi:hypothetical protein
MAPKNELNIAYGMVVILLVLGILSYTAFSAKPPDEPIRIMFQSTAGKVLFTHQTHSSEVGYGVACRTCHHHLEEDDESANQPCAYCHAIEEGSVVETEGCLECHEADEIEDTEMPVPAEVFHEQCITCHMEYEAGPTECLECHVL